MKRYTLLFTFFLFNIQAFAQTKIDKNISIDIPGNVFRYDTTIANTSCKAFYSNNKEDSYAVFRLSFLENGSEMVDLPNNLASLKRIYYQTIPSQISSMERKGFIFKDSIEIEINHLIAYRLIYKDEYSEAQNAESIILSLDGIIYVITYGRVDHFIEKNKDDFLKSLTIVGSPNQILNATSLPYLSLGKGIIGIFLLVIIIILNKRRVNRSSILSINLKDLHCPVCNKKQPRIRIPRNLDQILWGGVTCSNCKTQMDKYGNIIIHRDK